jgi:acetyl-CoA acetyltransferase
MYRDKPGLGVWEHRSKVAAVGIGMSDIDRRWDGNLETSLGAYTMIAIQKCLDDAGVSLDDIDGLVTCPVGMGGPWNPRPYFPAPYDTEDGLSGVSADWLVKNMNMKNVNFTMHGPGCIASAMSIGAQAVGDGLANTLLVVRGSGNLEGRYGHEVNNPNAGDTIGGAGQWDRPYGFSGGPEQVAYVFDQYCRKYGSNHDRMAPFIVNQRRNGLMFPEGYYAQHRPDVFTTEDYLNGRYIWKPMSINDCDLPCQTAAAFLFTTADRAKTMKQPPAYVLNHTRVQDRPRSQSATLAEYEASTDRLAQQLFEGSGLTPSELDVINPYDGFALFTQYYLEALQWHGVKRGDAHDFYAGDISVEGPHPFMPSGGNNGSGRTRWWHYVDSIQQVQGRAGQRQVKVRAETSLAGGPMPMGGDWMIFAKNPD